MTDFASLIRHLSEAGVDCIVIGGFAGTIHGAARLNVDLDLPLTFAERRQGFRSTSMPRQSTVG